MADADKLRDANPWHPISDPVDLAHLGKLGEELNECGSAVATQAKIIALARNDSLGIPSRAREKRGVSMTGAELWFKIRASPSPWVAFYSVYFLSEYPSNRISVYVWSICS